MRPRRESLVRALRLLIGLTILAVVLSRVDRAALVQALHSISPVHFVLGFLAALASSILVPAIVTSRTLRVAGIHITLPALVRINLAIRFYVLLLPTPVTVGLRWLQYRGAAPGKGWQVAALIMFERVLQAATVLAAAFVFLLIAGSSVPGVVRVLLPLSGAFAVAALGVLMLFLSRRAFSIVWPGLEALARPLPRGISARLDRLAQAIRSYHTLEHREVVSIVLWTIAADLLAVIAAVIVSRGLRLELDFADVGWMRATIFLLSQLPITIGGLGIREAGYVALFRLYGIEPSLALAFPLVLLFMTLLMGLAGGILEGIRVLGRRTEIGAQAPN